MLDVYEKEFGSKCDLFSKTRDEYEELSSLCEMSKSQLDQLFHQQFQLTIQKDEDDVEILLEEMKEKFEDCFFETIENDKEKEGGGESTENSSTFEISEHLLFNIQSKENLTEFYELWEEMLDEEDELIFMNPILKEMNQFLEDLISNSSFVSQDQIMYLFISHFYWLYGLLKSNHKKAVRLSSSSTNVVYWGLLMLVIAILSSCFLEISFLFFFYFNFIVMLYLLCFFRVFNHLLWIKTGNQENEKYWGFTISKICKQNDLKKVSQKRIKLL